MTVSHLNSEVYNQKEINASISDFQKVMNFISQKQKLKEQKSYYWSRDEEKQLLWCVEQYGSKWSFIQANYFAYLSKYAIDSKYRKIIGTMSPEQLHQHLSSMKNCKILEKFV
ncbi:SANT/Myb_domain [Hexamita inflata]|uniref:SANT/Myb domain n=1 Tax=Hexamita inflata TaxID=28002 RepID=A0AA86NUU3_9EUKA|nr:SANT/Myb domain [Hexamita inflata]